MLRKARICLAIIFFVGITLLLAGWWDDAPAWLGWMPKIQFLPALMAGSIGILAGLLLLTLVFGRVYCSVICPLGVMQDGISWIHGRSKKLRFSYSPEIKWLRYGVWVLYVAAIIAGLQAAVALLAPYSAYGRMVSTLLGPFWTQSLTALLIALVTFGVIAVLAWKNGRTWCNAICPVGTTLSLVSRFSLLRPVIDESKCKNCRKCERACKAACISIKDHKIDYSRCVDCFDCIDNCSFGALKYRFAYGKKSSPAEEPDGNRREVLKAGAIALAGLASAKIEAIAQDNKKRDGGLAEITPKQDPERQVPLTPFGSRSVDDFYHRCTACQLCVSVCPNGVLSPSTDLSHLMQPEMSYAGGWCRPECTKCSQVCPSGAILPLTAEEKTSHHIGYAVVDRDLCVVETDGVSCGNCARHCPAGAIMMVHKDKEDPDSAKIPAVNTERCIGCGACEYVCPSRPISAIHVEGRKDHITN